MIALGSDHGGYALKESVKQYLNEKNIAYEDYGCYDTSSADYPEYSKLVAEAVQSGKAEKGILFCGTGLGMMLCANKFEGIRAICTNDCYSVKLSRIHNNANIICFGGRVTGVDAAIFQLELFLNTAFEGGRHEKRVLMFDKILPDPNADSAKAKK